jgi:hypothetical protein
MEAENNGGVVPRKSNDRQRGTQIRLAVPLSNLDLIRAYRRVFDGTENNLYYLLMVAPSSLRDEYPTSMPTKLESMLTEKFEALSRMNDHVSKLLTDNNAEMGEPAGAEKVQMSVRTRLAKQYADLWAKCDETLLKIDSAWLYGYVTDAKRSEYVASVIKQVNKFWTQTSAEYRGIQRLLVERRKRNGQSATSEENAEIADPRPSEVQPVLETPSDPVERGLKAA